MDDYIKKYNSSQHKKDQHKHYLTEARKAWEVSWTNLVEEKKKLGYSEMSMENFLLEFPSLDKTQEEMSRFINVQSDIKKLEEERQVLWAEDLAVEELNKKHALIHVDQSYILTEKPNPIFGGQDFTLESKQSFRTQYENKLVQCPDEKMRTKADIWLKSSLRREYKGIIFDPKQDVAEYYNLWKGFVKEPKEGDCSRYWEHVLTNICNNNQNFYQFVRKWIAMVFQHPDDVHTALVLCGSQGTGKNSFVEPLGVLLGQHYVLLSSLSELVSHFNYHLKHAVLIHANESIWGGDRRDIGTLKGMITERTCLIEGKGKDRFMVRNFKHVILSSNEDWPVHLDRDDRRFFVLNVSEKHKEDHAYFAAIDLQLKSGGYEALLYDLLNEPLEGFNPRVLPENSAAFGIKLKSARSSHKYIYESLLELSFGIAGSGGEGIWQSISKQDLFIDYSAWCKNNGERIENKETFTKDLKKLVSSVKEIRPTENGVRVRKYSFPDIEVARAEFCKAYKVGAEIWEGALDEKNEF